MQAAIALRLVLCAAALLPTAALSRPIDEALRRFLGQPAAQQCKKVCDASGECRQECTVKEPDKEPCGIHFMVLPELDRLFESLGISDAGGIEMIDPVDLNEEGSTKPPGADDPICDL